MVETVTCHARDNSRAPPETSRCREIEPLDPEIEERLAIMTICGEMTEMEARAVLGLVPI